MSVILARLAKPGRSCAAVEDIWRRLPYETEPRVDVYRRGAAEVILFHYGAALDASVIPLEDGGLLIVQGQRTRRTLDRLAVDLADHKHGSDPLAVPECLLALMVREDQLTVFAGHPGTDQLLSTQTDDEFIWTNHQALLGPWLSGRERFNRTSLAWMIHKFHLGDYQYYLEGVSRTRPGVKYVAQPDGITEIAPRKGVSYTPISDADVADRLNEFAADIEDFLATVEAGKTISLSGGKDSRAIMGLLGTSDHLRRYHFMTFGEPYAPDVMAAHEVMEMAQLTDRHHIDRRQLIQRGPDLIRSVVDDVLMDFIGTSLADRQRVQLRPDLLIGGHQYGMKAKATYPDRATYLAQRAKAFEVSTLLTADTRQHLKSLYMGMLDVALAGVPDSKLEMTEQFVLRSPMHTAGSITLSHAGAAEFHPFLDCRIHSILGGVRPEFTQAQMLHYLLVRRFDKSIEAAAFAGDAWPTQTAEFADRMGLPLRRTPQPPFDFNPAFPSQSAFGRYQWRIDIFERMRRRVADYIRDVASDLDFLDVQAVGDLVMRPSGQWSFGNLYQLGAIFKVVLVHRLGATMLDARRREEIERIVAEFIGDPPLQTVTPHVDVAGAGDQSGTAPVQQQSGAAVVQPEGAEDQEALAARAALVAAEMAIRDLVLQQRTGRGLRPALEPERLRQVLGEDPQALQRHNELYASATSLGPFYRLGDALDFCVHSDNQGAMRFRGQVLKESGDRVLIAMHGIGHDQPVTGMTWSPSGFWYIYIVQDSRTSMFEYEVTVPGGANQRVECSVRRWAGNAPVFIRVDGVELVETQPKHEGDEA
ncbi:hypothetical protein [Devriesea agamarum]|uniref:hypothetical protein n=1 Tax=Devriesea agamarum TaxID=472569 RepID=UPI00071DD382|nr:hypothetical protein [Devriesea agamarum]